MPKHAAAAAATGSGKLEVNKKHQPADSNTPRLGLTKLGAIAGFGVPSLSHCSQLYKLLENGDVMTSRPCVKHLHATGDLYFFVCIKTVHSEMASNSSDISSMKRQLEQARRCPLPGVLTPPLIVACELSLSQRPLPRRLDDETTVGGSERLSQRGRRVTGFPVL